ncbi:MAG: cyclase family protein [Allosphingosinicella sp.]|uniref:cyclase family protein n=1 Tax=Allosphingosinicella sp. TaxID=2823234 RepID=UPI00395EEDEA
MTRLVDLSHSVGDGTVTYKGLPAPRICDFWTREGSAEHYDDGSSFQIGRIDMVANTGTYLDTPFHRYADGDDLGRVGIERCAGLNGILVRSGEMAVDANLFESLDVRGKAVLVHTGWSRHWGSETYFEDHPFLTEAAARLLANGGAALVGIDSYNIDDTRTRMRPVHTILLGARTLIVEHMTNLDALPERGFRFTAAPPKIQGMGTFPVRAFAEIV